MTRKEMLHKLSLYDGLGVRIEHEDGTVTYAHYEDCEGEHAIDRAYRQNKNKKLTFYGQSYARRELFLGYMEEYREACAKADKADEEIATKPYDEDVEVAFINAHSALNNMVIVLCRRLIHWTGCNFASAKKQIVTDSVTYSAF